MVSSMLWHLRDLLSHENVIRCRINETISSAAVVFAVFGYVSHLLLVAGELLAVLMSPGSVQVCCMGTLERASVLFSCATTRTYYAVCEIKNALFPRTEI